VREPELVLLPCHCCSPASACLLSPPHPAPLLLATCAAPLRHSPLPFFSVSLRVLRGESSSLALWPFGNLAISLLSAIPHCLSSLCPSVLSVVNSSLICYLLF